MEKLNIEYVGIDTIKPYEKNAKLHPKKQIEQIKKSIQDFGMNDPIALWKDEIVEGHGRLIACKELGFVKAMKSASSTKKGYDADVNDFLRRNQKKYGYKYKTYKF